MERKGFVHRDLKPDNILLNSKDENICDVRIADFGFAVKMVDIPRDSKYIFGTPGYIPPEALKGLGYNLKSDIFSVGAILYNILTRRPLFTGKTEGEALYRNKKCNLDPIKKSTSLSMKAKDLLKLLLCEDPEKRPRAAEALKHGWFKKERENLR